MEKVTHLLILTHRATYLQVGSDHHPRTTSVRCWPKLRPLNSPGATLPLNSPGATLSKQVNRLISKWPVSERPLVLYRRRLRVTPMGMHLTEFPLLAPPWVSGTFRRYQAQYIPTLVYNRSSLHCDAQLFARALLLNCTIGTSFFDCAPPGTCILEYRLFVHTHLNQGPPASSNHPG